MSSLLILSVIWLFSEIALSRLLRAPKSHNNLDKSSLKILWTTISLSITIGVLVSNTANTSITDYLSVINLTGVSLIALGLIIRWFAILTLKKSFTVNVSVSDDQILVQSGLYKYIRHPSYLGSLMSFLGLGITFNNWISLFVIFVPICFSFLYRIKIEEDVLGQAFGNKYSNYVKKSWKLIPKVF